MPPASKEGPLINRTVLLILVAVLVAAVIFAAFTITDATPTPAPIPAPTPTPVPTPTPTPPTPPTPPRPCPPWRPCPRSVWNVEASVGSNIAPDGTEVQLDLPPSLHLKNRGGSDGAGLCVFASLTHSGRWAEDPVFKGLFDYMTTQPGGGYPEKVDRVVSTYAAKNNLPKPNYLQVEGKDLEVLKTATKNGLMPGVTYSFSPTGRYGGQRIAHMVSLVHLDDKWAGLLDNNFPGTIEWMTPLEFQKTYTGGGGGWAVILLKDGPPPVPHNTVKE
jgi:hypothetical protein